MSQIFGFAPGQYLITDESSLFDFTGQDDMEMTELYKRIQDRYEIGCVRHPIRQFVRDFDANSSWKVGFAIVKAHHDDMITAAKWFYQSIKQ